MPTYTVDGITWNYTLNGNDATIGTGSGWANATTSGTGLSGAITVPDTVDGYSVTSLAASSFGNSSITSITLPNTLTTIGNTSFQGAQSLTSVTIPASVTSIGGAGFNYCSGITSLIFEDNSVLDSLGVQCFMNCSSLTSITLPESLTSMSTHVFMSCSSLTSINIPDSVTTIGSYTFNATHADLIVAMNTKTIDGTTYTSPTTSDISFFGNSSVTLVLPPTPQVSFRNRKSAKLVATQERSIYRHNGRI